MRNRLILVSGAVTTMVALAFIIPLALLVRELAADRALTAAERDAQLVAQFLSAVAPEQGLETAISGLASDDLLSGRALSIVLPDNRVIGAPTAIDDDIELARAGQAFRQVATGGEAVLVPVILSDGSTTVVRVFVTDAELTQNVYASWATLGLLGLFLISLAIAVADRMGRSMVRPVTELSEAAHRLGSGDLATRVEPSGPAELEEVGRAFNLLATRVAGLMEQERETAADLSHRLRTPLTAVRLDAERLAGHPGADRLIEGLDELERTVDHVIREARRGVRSGVDEVTDLGSVAAARAEFWGALAEEQGRRWESTIPTGVDLDVRGAGADVEAAVDALLGNVLAHTPEGSPFHLHVEPSADTVSLILDDAGPGFDDDAVERGRSGRGSTGLGLDIVRRTAEASGGSVRILTSPQGGARVVAVFGRPEDVGEQTRAGRVG